jgi:hypothetical protein
MDGEHSRSEGKRRLRQVGRASTGSSRSSAVLCRTRRLQLDRRARQLAARPSQDRIQSSESVLRDGDGGGDDDAAICPNRLNERGGSTRMKIVFNRSNVAIQDGVV